VPRIFDNIELKLLDGLRGLLPYKRWQYGVPPAGNANFAWVQQERQPQ
jgi:hypothetical protein